MSAKNIIRDPHHVALKQGLYVITRKAVSLSSGYILRKQSEVRIWSISMSTTHEGYLFNIFAVRFSKRQNT